MRNESIGDRSSSAINLSLPGPLGIRKWALGHVLRMYIRYISLSCYALNDRFVSSSSSSTMDTFPLFLSTFLTLIK
jgi:hypothetical protein